MSSFRKTSVQEFQHQIKDIRTQLFDQIKCLEQRTDVQVAILGEVNDFLKKKAELDLEYSKHLDKLVKSVMLKHKNEKQKRANWTIHSTCQLWQQIVDDTKEEARQRSITAEVYANHVGPSIAQRSTALQKISKKCREVGILAQGEVIRVLHELQTAMKTYQLCFVQFNMLSTQLKLAEAQRNKVGSNGSTRKQRSVQKTYDKKSEKFEAARLKCTRARNEYLLCIDAANASLHKFFADDISDLVDCCDLGMEWWLSMILQNMIAVRKSACQVEMNALANLGSFKDSLHSLTDKQRFFENNHQAFMLPKCFDYKCEEAEKICQISVTEGTLAEEFRQRHHQIRKRLDTLRAESELSWQNMESTEKQIRDLLSACTYVEVTEFGIASNEDRRPSLDNLEGELAKAYDSYMQTFSYYLFNANLIMRLEARADGIGNALAAVPYPSPSQQTQPTGSISSATGPIGFTKNGPASAASSSITGQQLGPQNSEPIEPPDSLEWAQRRRKKRIGSQASTEQPPPSAVANPLWRRPRLFGGNLEEYTELTGEPIPLIVVSCIRVLSQYALHHQGIFRVSGSQLEINHMREAFEIGEDPLRDVQDASDANSIAGVLKLYLRELSLFPFYLFDLLTDCAKCASTADFINKIYPLLNKLPRPTYLLLRYLFTFLNHLSEFSDENMMDPYNLAICFGPTLLPIPEGKDQVYYQNSVNEVVKNLIVHADSIFTARVPGPRYEKYSLEAEGTPAGEMSNDLDLFVDDDVATAVAVVEQQHQLEDWSLLRQQKRLSNSDLPFPPPSPQFHRLQQRFQQQNSQLSPQRQHRLPFISNHQTQQGPSNEFTPSDNGTHHSMTKMDWSLVSSANSNMVESSAFGGEEPTLCPSTADALYKQHATGFPTVTNNNTYCYSSSESGVGESGTISQKKHQQHLALGFNGVRHNNENAMEGKNAEEKGIVAGSRSPNQQQHPVRQSGENGNTNKCDEFHPNPGADLYASIHKGDRVKSSATMRSPQSTTSVMQRQSNREMAQHRIPHAAVRLGCESTGSVGISPPPYSALYGPGGGRSPPMASSVFPSERKAIDPTPAVGPSPNRRRNSITSASTSSSTTVNVPTAISCGSNVQPSIAMTSVSVVQQQPPIPSPTTASTTIKTAQKATGQPAADQLRRQRRDQINAIDELLDKLSSAGVGSTEDEKTETE